MFWLLPLGTIPSMNRVRQVVLPEPVGPDTIKTWWSLNALRNSGLHWSAGKLLGAAVAFIGCELSLIEDEAIVYRRYEEVRDEDFDVYSIGSKRTMLVP